MNLGIKVNKNIVNYILNKLSALGLLVFIMCIYLMLASKFDLYEFTSYFSNIKIWGLICGYALIVTILIDLVRYKWREVTDQTSILLHSLAGFIIFLPFMGVNVYSLIAGSVGVLCAFIYAFSYYFFAKKTKFVRILILIFPLLLCLRLFDFTIKEGWTEEKTKSSYSAEFEHFNGKIEIPISLKKGEIVRSYISLNRMNEGGYGYQVLDNDGKPVGMEELENTVEKYQSMDMYVIQFNAEKAGKYILIVSGDHLKGRIDIKWEIDCCKRI